MNNEDNEEPLDSPDETETGPRCGVCEDIRRDNNYAGDGSKLPMHESYSILAGGLKCCHLCSRKNTAKRNRETAVEGSAKQAENMMKHSRDRFPPAAQADTVSIRVPDVVRGRTVVLACVVDTRHDDLYELATVHGILEQLYARSQFTICPENLLNLIDVPHEKEITFREVVKLGSKCGGQGYCRSHCKTKCGTNKCKCKASGVLCNSKCHGSGSCQNKLWNIPKCDNVC